MALWARRPFWMTKLGQLARLVHESHARPLTGEPGMPRPAPDRATGVMFLGHSSFLLQFGAVAILVDPVFSTRLILLRRQRRPGVRVADLPRLDAVLVTHAHMDHLDRPTLRRVVRAQMRRFGRAPVAIVPPGLDDLVRGLGFAGVHALAWWQATEVSGVTVTATPARHWGARMFRDTHRGFGGYVVRPAQGAAVYHSGDTAWFPGFAEIGARLRPEIALLPIGAYSPDSYRGVHTSPEEAVRAFVAVGARAMVPMHFGTFRLGLEPMDEPPVRLMAEARRLGIEQRVTVLAEGETKIFESDRSQAQASK